MKTLTLAALTLVTLTTAPAMAQQMTQTADGNWSYSITARDVLANPDLLTAVIAGLTASPDLRNLHSLAVSEGRFAGDIVDFAYAWIAVNGVFAAPPATASSLCDDPNRNPAQMVYCG